MPGRLSNSLRLIVIVSLLVIAVATLVAGVASAHADVARSDPAANSTLDSAPAQVTIWFNEPIEPAFSKITVLFEDGSGADAGDSTISPADPQQLSVSLTDKREGSYIVSWRALSSIDGHITSGAFVFSVGKPINQSVGGNSGGAITSPFDMLARALTFIGQALLVGAMLFRWLVWRPALKSAQLDDSLDTVAMARGQRLVFIAFGLTAVGALLTLIAQSSLAGATIPSWLGTRVGRVWIGRVATLIALGVLARDVAAVGSANLSQGSRPRGIALNLLVGWLGLQLLFLTSLTSHSAAVASPPLRPFAADWIHLIGTALWVGGLAQLAFVVPAAAKTLEDEDRAWLWLKTVVYFSTIAAAALGLLIITGTYMSFLHVGDWQALITTIYGRTLLFKLTLAGVAMLIGAYNLFVVKPRLDRAVDSPDEAATHTVHRRFRRIAIVEAVVGMLVLASAGILTDLPRSKDPQPAVSAGPLQLATQADNLDVTLTIDPARSGLSNYNIRLTQNGQPLTDAQEVSLRFTYLTRGLGTTKATASLTPDGTYATSGAYLSLTGEWQIEAAVRRPRAFDAFAAYRVKIDLDGHVVPVTAETPIDALTRWLSIYGLAFGGFVAIGLGLSWLVIGWKASRNVWSQVILLVPVLLAIPIGVRSVATFFSEATPGLTLTNPFLPDEQSLAIGEQLFKQNCAVCHGDAGRGNGPGAANLSHRPPDFGDGHLDIHPDGDVVYWIQNGFGPSSPMPAFKDKLGDDDIWHLVNYVRRLRNLAGQAVLTATPAAQPAYLQPYTPPSFIAPNAVLTSNTPIAPTPSAPNDPAAIDLLKRSDAAMNALTSLVEQQSIKDDSGHSLEVRFEYAAPNRLRYIITGGATAIEIDASDYQQKPDGSWLKNQRAVPFAWPNYTNSRDASGARLDGTDQIDGAQTTIVAFTYSGFDFRLWIDSTSHRILKLTMDGPDHHMLSIYSQFDSGPAIEPPIP